MARHRPEDPLRMRQHLLSLCSPRLPTRSGPHYFSLMSVDSSWTRYPKTRTAVRGLDEGRITLMLQRDGWVAMVGSKSHHLDSSAQVTLDEAIDLIDQLFLPEGWTCFGNNGAGSTVKWLRAGWVCWDEGTDSWRVGRPAKGQPVEDVLLNLVPATAKVFRSADRARHWAEVRLDRTNTNLRGPRPRADQKALKTLPDVRVTDSERAQAVALADRLGVSYSDLARAALRLIDEKTASGEILLARAGGGVHFTLRV